MRFIRCHKVQTAKARTRQNHSARGDVNMSATNGTACRAVVVRHGTAGLPPTLRQRSAKLPIGPGTNMSVEQCEVIEPLEVVC